jgi:8-oxo-dGTP pyrophosphatase MutT (NUDIX family)
MANPTRPAPDTPASPAATRPLVPRDAATLILVDGPLSSPRILMGRRRGDLAFLPGKYVFPGGRVDDTDRRLAANGGSTLDPVVIEKLLLRMRGKPSRSRAHALARAAIRETHEETGIRVGADGSPPLDALRFVARAITPPGRTRRYDTRFFLADARLVTSTGAGSDGELDGLDWFTLDQIRALDLPGITRLVIEDIAQLSDAPQAREITNVPFYFHRAGQFHRDLL